MTVSWIRMVGVCVLLSAGWATQGVAATYTVNVLPGSGSGSTNYTWEADAFTPAGVPGINDTVIYGASAWYKTCSLTLDAGASCGTLILTNANQANTHSLIVGHDSTIGSLISYRQNKSGQDHKFQMNNSVTLNITEYHDLGTYRANTAASGTSDSEWNFQGDAKITYHTESPQVHWAMRLDFTNATSVHLARSPNAVSLDLEEIQPRSANGGDHNLSIGRADNGEQNWTVEAGSHPVLVCVPGSGRQSISKRGTGDVNMPDVDIALRIAGLDAAINTTGSGWATPSIGQGFDGTILANSLSVSATHASDTRFFHVAGHIQMDGQGGLQAGGSGNGHAFYATTSNGNMEVFAQYGQHNGPHGHFEVTPAGGDFFLETTGVGTNRLRIVSQARDNSPPRSTNAIVTANTITFSTANCYLTDRNRHWDFDDEAGGVVQFRGDFVNRSTLADLWRWDHSVLRCIDGGANEESTIECPSQDNGTSGPGTGNFELWKLVVGQDYLGATGTVTLRLGDAADNHTALATGEVLYVQDLQLFASSRVVLNGRTLYYKNSGSWQEASVGTFADGDGTGRIVAHWPPAGTVVFVK